MRGPLPRRARERWLAWRCAGASFFFQAEDGIRDWSVTGVQTCALPIWPLNGRGLRRTRGRDEAGARASTTRWMRWRHLAFCGRARVDYADGPPRRNLLSQARSEERRVGKEVRCRGARDTEK